MKTEIKIEIPVQMQILCNMMEISPETVFQKFADDLSLATEGMASDNRMKMATEYFMQCGLELGKYKQQQTDMLFKELDELLKQHPNDKAYVEIFLQKWQAVWEGLRKA